MNAQCPCQRCGRTISFERETLTAQNRIVTCPSCGQETMLFVAAPIAVPAPPVIPQGLPPAYRLKDYEGFYRSSDEKSIGGVCAGLAHKWNMNRSGIQIGFILLGLFFIIGVIMYIACWAAFKSLPTRGVRIS